MIYDPKLGVIGNLKKVFSELNRNSQNMHDTQNNVQRVEDSSASWNDIAAAITEGVNDVE